MGQSNDELPGYGKLTETNLNLDKNKKSKRVKTAKEALGKISKSRLINNSRNESRVVNDNTTEINSAIEFSCENLIQQPMGGVIKNERILSKTNDTISMASGKNQILSVLSRNSQKNNMKPTGYLG